MTAPGVGSVRDEPTLVDLLDRTISAGAALSGDVVLSVAEVDLIHLGLRLVLRGLDGPLDSPAISPRPVRQADPPRASRSAVVSAADRPPPRTGVHHDARSDAEASGDLSSQLGQLVAGGAAGELEPADVQRGLAALVLTLVEVLRELMERQALRRMEHGSLDDDEIERLGATFLALRDRMEELKDAFGLSDEDLTLDLGPLGYLR